MLQARGLIDLLIPRGGASLIDYVVGNAKVPVIETGVGNCHIYVEEDADLEKAVPIIVNAKCQRPGTCNAVEKLLVNSKIAENFLPAAVAALKKGGVEIRGDKGTVKIIPDAKPATEQDWYTE
jgi:glutamate-5-semialdehyde dehydrogenase